MAVIIDWVPNHVSPHNIFENFDGDKTSSYYSLDIT